MGPKKGQEAHKGKQPTRPQRKRVRIDKDVHSAEVSARMQRAIMDQLGALNVTVGSRCSRVMGRSGMLFFEQEVLAQLSALQKGSSGMEQLAELTRGVEPDTDVESDGGVAVPELIGELEWPAQSAPVAVVVAPPPGGDKYLQPQQLQGEVLITLSQGCILWGSRVVVPPPPPLQKRVLESLHETHPGIVRMKALARSYVWWPRMDKEIENGVRRCSACQESRPEPPSAPVTCWETTRKPWSRLHLDFAGPFQGQIFLIMVDAYTKWLEVIPVASTSSAAAIRALHRALSTHGIPDTIVTDNGAAFTSGDFQAFLQRYLIRHIRSAPFHPATNGQAERMVQTTKEALGR
ncbi:LOW QUALITY PROTEIN: uncharacterized protein K02A2.6-like, partial [Heteronotia binoei]|uniref:LOW QUALITY PROTEIN: uncharacterized protein K02A2.6-like n=1 Tax=Heteronotia binoei TaxID=13085 RepID=UPI00292D8329